MANVRFFGYFGANIKLKYVITSINTRHYADFSYLTVLPIRPRHRFFYFKVTERMRLARPSTNPHGKDPFLYGFRSYIELQLNFMAIRGFYGHNRPKSRLPFLLFTFISVPTHRSYPLKNACGEGREGKRPLPVAFN